MKKIFKNVTLIVVTLVVMFGVVAPVSAASSLTIGKYKANNPSYKDATTMTKTSPTFTLNSIGVSLDGTTGSVDYYYHKDAATGNPLFCLDSVLPSGNNLYARRFLFYSTELESLREKDLLGSKSYAYDVAVMAVLKASSVNSNSSYFSTSLALRVISALWGYLDTQSAGANQLYGGKAQEVLGAINTLAYNWANDGSDIEKDAYKISQLLKGSSFQNVSRSSYVFSGTPVEKAKELVTIGIKAAREHLESVANGNKLEVSDQNVVNNTTTEEGLVSKSARYTFIYTNSVNPEFYIDSITLKEGVNYGLLNNPYVTNLTINDTVVCENANASTCDVIGKNILTLGSISPDENGAYKIVMDVRFDGYEKVPTGSSAPMLNCNEMPIDYTIKISYNKGNTTSIEDYEKYLGVVWYNRPSGHNKQRFISYEGESGLVPDDGDGKGNHEINDTIALIEKCDCDELEKLCEESGDTNSAACKQLDELWKNGVCDDCDILEAFCKIEGEDSIYCEQYKSNEECVDCDDAIEACDKTNDMSSPECQELKKLWDKGICDDCTTLETLCKLNGDGSEYCIKYQEKVEKGECPGTPDSVQCETEVVPITECCDAEGNLVADAAFGPESMMSQDYEIHGIKKDEIKTCFVDNAKKDPVDEKDNKYQMVSNSYCSVNCREDYAITFPTAKRVNAGRYFTFHVNMESHKQCFTSKIDKAQFKKDVEEALKMINEGFNGYQEWYGAVKANHVSDGVQPIATNCGTGGTATSCSLPTSTEVSNGGHTDIYTYYTYEFVYDYGKMDLTSLGFRKPNSTYKEKHMELGSGTSCGSISTISGVVDCGTVYPDVKGVTFGEFEAELEAKAQEYKDMYEEGIKKLYDVIIPSYKDCTDWETEYNTDPKVQYTYDENYKTLAGMPIDMDKELNVSDTTYLYCTDAWTNDSKNVDVNATYETCQNGSGFGNDSRITLNFAKCNLETGECEMVPEELSQAVFKKSNNDATSSYKPQSIFWNVYPSGNIIVNGSPDNAVQLVESLPVALNTKKGVHDYSVYVSNIGEYYDTGEQGRFAGDDGVLEAITGSNIIDYTCAYLVNIPTQTMKCTANPCEGPDCKTECIGEGCDDFDCDGVDCITDCVGIGCIYDTDAGTSVLQKQVTLNKLFPNGTDSYNWVDENAKGKATKDEIEAAGNTIYEGTPILSITINPSTSKAIRNYNKSVLNSGGYSNETIKCQNVSGVGDQLACYSSFIDDLINGVYGDVVKEYDTSRKTDHNVYFTFWSGELSEELMIGPAWK